MPSLHMSMEECSDNTRRLHGPLADWHYVKTHNECSVHVRTMSKINVLSIRLAVDINR